VEKQKEMSGFDIGEIKPKNKSVALFCQNRNRKDRPANENGLNGKLTQNILFRGNYCWEHKVGGGR